jgi:hypothetical protein
MRQDYDREISRIRAEIAGLGMGTVSMTWHTLVGAVTRTPFSRAKRAEAVAKLRVQLAEAHAAKFAALAELKILKAFV